MSCECGQAAPAGLSRRSLLVRAGLVAGAAAAAPLVSARAAWAAGGTWSGPVLVVLSLRGGFDGLSAVAPVGDPSYAALRPTIAVPAATALPTGDRRFGLHPALAPLLPLWTSGQMAAVHAVGTPDGSRSHFQATEELERAAPGSSVRSGWLDRVLGVAGTGSLFEAVHLGSGTAGALLAGSSPAYAARSLAGVFLDSSDWVGARQAAALRAMHGTGSSPASAGALTALDSLTRVAGVVAADPQPHGGAAYPAGSPLGAVLKDAATLIRSGLGLQALTVDVGDWDLHAGLGAAGGGVFATKAADLAASLSAFARDLGADFSRVTVVTMSEFGRRAAENDSAGADHGHGNAVLLLGGGLAGGAVHGTWPGLGAGALDQGDLAGTTDYRNVLAELLVKRTGVSTSALSTVFPGLAYQPVGAFT